MQIVSHKIIPFTIGRRDMILFLRTAFFLIFFALENKLSFSQSYNGQKNYDDALLLQNIFFAKNLTRNLRIYINEKGRLTENINQLGYLNTDVGMSYQINKKTRLSFGYMAIAEKKSEEFDYRHKFHADVTIKIRHRKFAFYDRQMIQVQSSSFNVLAKTDIPGIYMRNKITVKYKRESRYVPYIAAEAYYRMNRNKPLVSPFDKMRYFVGCSYELDNANELEFYYLIEPHIALPNSFINYIIGIGYSHNLQ